MNLSRCEESNAELNTSIITEHKCPQPNKAEREANERFVKSFATIGLMIIIAGSLIYYFSFLYLNRATVVLTGIDYLAICKEISSANFDATKDKPFPSLVKCNSSSEKITLQKNFDDEIKANLKKEDERIKTLLIKNKDRRFGF